MNAYAYYFVGFETDPSGDHFHARDRNIRSRAGKRQSPGLCMWYVGHEQGEAGVVVRPSTDDAKILRSGRQPSENERSGNVCKDLISHGQA